MKEKIKCSAKFKKKIQSTGKISGTKMLIAALFDNSEKWEVT